MNNVLIHCNPNYLPKIKDLGLNYTHAPNGEIDVIVDDLPYDYNHAAIDPDVQLCNQYGIDYKQVNCIEAI